jgi:alpha-N-acetylglucosamine transferase
MMRSLRRTGTRADVVVLVSPNVKEETRQVLRQDNAIVTEVPNLVNPYKAKKAEGQSQRFLSRFEFTLNKLYMWNLTQYERVVYLDADNIALGNFDELFDCGHFCAVFMNPCNFHTGLLVIKPDVHQFERMVHALYNHTRSYDGADQGFLTAFFPFKVCLISTFSQCWTLLLT